MKALLVALGLAGVPGILFGQTGGLRGTVLDARTGAAIEGATVATGRTLTRTDAAGEFRLVAAGDSAAFVVHALGFTAQRLAVTGDSVLMVRMEPAPLTLSPVLVSSERAFGASGSRTVRGLDLELRPRASSQQLLTVAPGLVVSQHAGGGKAEQIFLRGFDADHGTDVAISVDGTPVNLASHAHGQGYADLHYLIPDVIERVDVRKGPFDVRDGDFATAGAVAFRTRDRLEDRRITLVAGHFGERGVRAAVPFGGAASRSGGYLAATATTTDGPFDASQDHSRWNAFARWTAPVGGIRLRATASAYGAAWSASGQVPERAVRNGLIARFGAIDDTEGGTTARQEASLEAAGGSWIARAWAVRYELDLFSNFTFFRDDSLRGDGIVQRDRRTAFGFDGTVARGSYELGAGVRADAAVVALGRQERRVAIGTAPAAAVRPLHAYAWIGETLAIGKHVRVRGGLRADAFRFDARQAELRARSSSARLSPKLGVAYDDGDGLQLFGSAGTGFHSNDVRALLTPSTGDQPLVPRAIALEVGGRRTWSGVSVAAALWALDLESELVFVGDEGTTEAGGRSRRAGFDVEVRARLLTQLWLDADLAFAHARLRDAPAGEDRIPLAPTRTLAAGLTWRDGGPFNGAFRLRHIGTRPANEDGSVVAHGHTLFDLFAGAELGPIQLRAGLENLFDAAWNEAQFATTSRLRDEAAPTTELHFTPGAPRTFRVEVGWRF